MKKSMLIGATALVFLMSSCKKDETPDNKVSINEKTVEFLVNGSGRFGNYTLFSFAVGGGVPSTDSNSTKWDFGIRQATIIINNASSGPGSAFVKIVDKPFQEVTSAKLENFKYDTSVTQRAIKLEEWADYNPTARTFSPIAGKTFVFVTATGRYAKLEMLKAEPTDDNGSPVIPPTIPTKIKYTFRYAYQQNGTTNF
ncbi:MAG: HmuY family protein [Bacteroidetes bacterium]|nr:HmuY family protein [Bacteroidota bacterium]